MNISPVGIALVEEVEQCRLVAYWDAIGKVWTIGWGHTGAHVQEGLVWTQEQADAVLTTDLAGAQGCINRLVRVPLKQNQFDALCSFVYNVGCGAFTTSTLLRDINAGKFDLAAGQFPLWCHDHAGNVEQGLLDRRLKEQALFTGATP